MSEIVSNYFPIVSVSDKTTMIFNQKLKKFNCIFAHATVLKH